MSARVRRPFQASVRSQPTALLRPATTRAASAAPPMSARTWVSRPRATSRARAITAAPFRRPAIVGCVHCSGQRCADAVTHRVRAAHLGLTRGESQWSAQREGRGRMETGRHPRCGSGATKPPLCPPGASPAWQLDRVAEYRSARRWRPLHTPLGPARTRLGDRSTRDRVHHIGRLLRFGRAS